MVYLLYTMSKAVLFSVLSNKCIEIKKKEKQKQNYVSNKNV